MDTAQVIVFSVAIALMLVGVAGSILPVIPGVPLNFVVFLAYGYYSSFEAYGFLTIFLVGALTFAAIVVEQLAGIMGAKKFGSGKAGMIGAVVGSLVGIIIFNVPGLIIGTFLGALAFEMIFAKKEWKVARMAGLGALVGCACGSFFKFVVSFIITAAFIYLVIKNSF
jgi:uncharacterized protein YqgC (DUF456 family)